MKKLLLYVLGSLACTVTYTADEQDQTSYRGIVPKIAFTARQRISIGGEDQSTVRAILHDEMTNATLGRITFYGTNPKGHRRGDIEHIQQIIYKMFQETRQPKAPLLPTTNSIGLFSQKNSSFSCSKSTKTPRQLSSNDIDAVVNQFSSSPVILSTRENPELSKDLKRLQAKANEVYTRLLVENQDTAPITAIVIPKEEFESSAFDSDKNPISLDDIVKHPGSTPLAIFNRIPSSAKVKTYIPTNYQDITPEEMQTLREAVNQTVRHLPQNGSY